MPEFLNRIDETIIFHPLTKNTSSHRVTSVRAACEASWQWHHATVQRSVVDEIARLGYDPVYGARPLKRVIQQQNELAKELLGGEFAEAIVMWNLIRMNFFSAKKKINSRGT